MKIIVSVTTLLGRTFRVTYTCSARISRCFLLPTLIKTWVLFQVSCTIVTILYLAGTTLSLLSTGRLVTFTSRHLVVKEHGEQAWDEKQTNEN